MTKHNKNNKQNYKHSKQNTLPQSIKKFRCAECSEIKSYNEARRVICGYTIEHWCKNCCQEARFISDMSGTAYDTTCVSDKYGVEIIQYFHPVQKRHRIMSICVDLVTNMAFNPMDLKWTRDLLGVKSPQDMGHIDHNKIISATQEIIDCCYYNTEKFDAMMRLGFDDPQIEKISVDQITAHHNIDSCFDVSPAT